MNLTSCMIYNPIWIIDLTPPPPVAKMRTLIEAFCLLFSLKSWIICFHWIMSSQLWQAKPLSCWTAPLCLSAPGRQLPTTSKSGLVTKTHAFHSFWKSSRKLIRDTFKGNSFVSYFLFFLWKENAMTSATQCTMLCCVSELNKTKSILSCCCLIAWRHLKNDKQCR